MGWGLKRLTLLLCFFATFTLSPNAHPLKIKTSAECEMIFKYLDANSHTLSQQEIHSILNMPEQVIAPQDGPRPDPFAEISRAIEYASKYTPPTNREDATTLGAHRAFVLKMFLARIAEVYPVWTANISRLENGDYYFVGGKGNFIRVSDSDGSITKGNVFKQ
jgi:hypothetical protein